MKRLIAILLLLATNSFAQNTLDEPELTTTETGDAIRIVDVSDGTDDPAGSDKHITINNLLKLLHGDLNVNSFDIVSDAGIPINIIPGGTGEVILRNFAFDVDQTVGPGQDNYVLTYDNSGGLISLEPNGYGVPQAVTISGGVATLTGPARPMMAVVLTSEGGSGADILDTVTLAGIANGTNIQFSVASGSQVTFADGTDNLDLGADMLLDSTNETLILRYNGTNLCQVTQSPNALTVEKTVSETFTILEPDAVQGVSDDVVLKKFVAEDYPNGVTINAIHIDASAAYTSETFLFEHWDDASGTTQATVESITASAISTEDDGTLSDATIPADYFLVVNLDDTPEDKAYVSITIQYTVD